MRRTILCLSLLCFVACQPGDPGGGDAAAEDGAVAEVDGGPSDAGTVDARSADAGGVDAEVDPCDVDHGGCDPLTTCAVEGGAVVCGDCPAGYTGTGAEGCANVDECASSPAPCDALRVCTDTPGSYTCEGCIGGYAEVGSECVDVDECPDACDAATSCTNTVGSFECTDCPAPWLGNGRTGCVLAPPRVHLDLLPAARSLTRCTTAGRLLPILWDLRFADDALEGGSARLEITVTGSGGATPTLTVGSVGTAAIEEHTSTRIVAVGQLVDLQLGTESSLVRSTTVGQVLVVMRYCRLDGGACSELRDLLTIDEGNSISSVACDASPELEPASDDGASDADDFTSDFTPTFTVASAASSVTWLRDGVEVGSTPVVSGVATFTDDGTAAMGRHAYAVRHGSSTVPSAARYVTLSTGPAPRSL